MNDTASTDAKLWAYVSQLLDGMCYDSVAQAIECLDADDADGYREAHQRSCKQALRRDLALAYAQHMLSVQRGAA
jgi:hypothetical protein